MQKSGNFGGKTTGAGCGWGRTRRGNDTPGDYLHLGQRTVWAGHITGLRVQRIQVGQGTTTNCLEPKELHVGGSIGDISAGNWHTTLRNSRGQLFLCGR